VIFNYRFEDKRSPEFYLVAIPNPDYDPKDEKKNNEFLLFATSINFGSIEEFGKRVPEEYRRRWNIVVVQSILHNFLNVQKSILSITAYELKSLIVEDIQKYLLDGKFGNTVSFRMFYAKMASYNERRVIELRSQLAAS